MKIYAETDRMLLREILLKDAAAMFEIKREGWR